MSLDKVVINLFLPILTMKWKLITCALYHLLLYLLCAVSHSGQPVLEEFTCFEIYISYVLWVLLGPCWQSASCLIIMEEPTGNTQRVGFKSACPIHPGWLWLNYHNIHKSFFSPTSNDSQVTHAVPFSQAVEEDWGMTAQAVEMYSGWLQPTAVTKNYQ